MAEECVFCRIRDGKIPSPRVFEDERAFVIRDIHPRAPVHLLVIPREHIPTARDAPTAGQGVVDHLIRVANRVADQEGLAERGYRLVFNVGRESGMEVAHLHLHVLGGRSLGAMG
ncbi:MAG: histidine triad nucleotide-binding protein [Chloroflexi bacterium]|nr:histidine triad nucleotide-binding protein [Chloroflexota bacterium]